MPRKRVHNGKNRPTWALVRVEREAAELYQGQLSAARQFGDGQAAHIEMLERTIAHLRDEIELRDASNANLVRTIGALRRSNGEHEGRTAESWAYEAKYLRQIWHDHHLEGWCPAQAEANGLVNLLRDPKLYRKVDNWTVQLHLDGYKWYCKLCHRTFPAPLDYEWAVKPCPHPGAPLHLEVA